MGAGGRSLPKAGVGLLLLRSGLGLAPDIDPLRCCPGAKLDCLLGLHWPGIPHPPSEDLVLMRDHLAWHPSSTLGEYHTYG